MTKIRPESLKKKKKTVRTIATLTSNDTEILNSFTREAFPSASHLEDQCQRCKGGTTRRKNKCILLDGRADTNEMSLSSFRYLESFEGRSFLRNTSVVPSELQNL